jgi:hypothetical protein
MQAFALDAGVDIIAHGMWHWDVPPSPKQPAVAPPLGTVNPAVKKILDGVVARHVGWQPTLQVLPGERDLTDPNYLANPALARVYPDTLIEWYRTPEAKWFRDLIAGDFAKNPEGSARSDAEVQTIVQRIYGPLMGQVTNATAYVAQHRGNLLFGTDTPSAPSYANPPGLNGFMDMHRWIEAGLTPTQVLRAATLSNAEALKLTRDLGTVQAGKRANLLLMREDPTRSVDAYASIVKVVLGGRVLEASDLVADRPDKH